MAKVGHFVTDPRAGAYCQVTLDTGQKVIVSHDKGGFEGALLTIEVSKFMGFSSDRIFACNLDSLQGQALLAWLTRGAVAGSVAATVGAAVEFVRQSESLAELKERCATLMSAGQSAAQT
jgi:hypothetical protein